MVAARSLVVAAYHTKEEDTEIFVLSTKGNEHLIEKHKDKFGSDVMGDLYANAMFFTPKVDSCGDECGTDIVQLYSMNPNGNLPSMAATKLIEKQADSLLMITE